MITRCLLISVLLLTGITRGISGSDSLVINELMASNLTFRISPDRSDFVDWIEIYNSSDRPVSLDGKFITDDLANPFKWPLPEGETIAPHSYYILWADGLGDGNHTSFKLSGDGEQVGLFGPDGTVLDTITFDKQFDDISLGRFPDGADMWNYFQEPTPGGSDSVMGVISPVRTAAPQFSVPGGRYEGELSVAILVGAGAVVHYTDDGSIPALTSPVYSEPVTLSHTRVIRTRAFRDGFLPSVVTTQSYIIGEPTALPVISISTPPKFLFDDEIGITTGICVSNELGALPPFDPDANFWNSWERPVHLEYFTPEGVTGLDQDAGIAIFGGAFGRQIEQKAFTLYARDKYGDRDFDFPLFPSKPVNSFRRFLLRCSSNDFNRTYIRDAMMNTLVSGQMDVDYQAYQPTIVYLNGEFWGLYNIREKTNHFYPESNYGIDPDQVDLVEGFEWTAHGDGSGFYSLMDFVADHNMAFDENYETVRQQIDAVEFMNYFIAEIYVCNRDWLHQNIKSWRQHEPPGKWRWLLYDMDWGFNGEFVLGPDQYVTNTLQWATEQGEASLLFSRLLENKGFREEFVQRFATHLNLTFAPNRVHEIIDHMQERIASDMPRQIERWGAIKSMDYWNRELDVLYQFADNRPLHMNMHLEGLIQEEKSELILEVSDPQAGTVEVYGVPCPVPVFGGLWFRNLPIQVTAKANPGWKFVGWQGSDTSGEDTLYFTLSEPVVLHALFEPNELPNIVISEIHYNPSSDLQGEDEEFEFVELVNREEADVDISGFRLTGGVEFTFPPGSIAGPGECILLAKNPRTYNHIQVQVYEISGGRLDNAGEKLILLNSQGELIDEVYYDDHYPWPETPDGDGSSLELSDLSLDNGLPRSWTASKAVGGTPGWYPGSEVSVEEISTLPSTSFTVWPNPFSSGITVGYNLANQGLVRIDILNPMGQIVNCLINEVQEQGIHAVRWEPGNTFPGIYFIRIREGMVVQIKKVIYVGQGAR